MTNSARKRVILLLMERGGEIRSYHIEGSTVREVILIVQENVSHKAQTMTDKSDEISSYLFAVGTSWAMANVLMTRGHVRIYALHGGFGPRPATIKRPIRAGARGRIMGSYDFRDPKDAKTL